MVDLKRESPIRFTPGPIRTEERDGWIVAMEYENEDQGPFVIDLAHKTRWDLQDGSLDDLSVPIPKPPAAPGESLLEGGVLVNRMNRTQASIYHLGGPAPPKPDFRGFTDVSEVSVFLAIIGPGVFGLAEKLTDLDFMGQTRRPPFLLQGPFCRVPCQIVALEVNEDGSGGFLLTCSRGYGESLIQAVMRAGREFGLRPAGEKAFNRFLETLGQ